MRRVVHAQALHTRPSPRLSTGLLSVVVDGGVAGGDGSRFLARAITCASSASTVICARNTRVRGRHVRRAVPQLWRESYSQNHQVGGAPCMIVAFRASPRRWTLLLPSGAPIWGQAAPSSGGSWRLKGRSAHGQLQGSRPQCGHLAGRQLSPRCPRGGRGHLHPDQLCGGRERGPPISGALRRCRSPPRSASTPRSSAPANCAATARFSRCLSVAEIRARFTLCGCSQAVGRSGAVLHQRARPPTCRERGRDQESVSASSSQRRC